jgi:hypothetical protein
VHAAVRLAENAQDKGEATLRWPKTNKQVITHKQAWRARRPEDGLKAMQGAFIIGTE